MLLNELFDTSHADNPEVSGLTADSRKVEPGFVFVALSGSSVDGRDYVDEALAKGAAAIVCDAPLENAKDVPVPVLHVADGRRELALAAARMTPKQPGTMAAVTGTAGKTSVASFLRQLWLSMDQAGAMIGTTGVEAPGKKTYGSLTTPDPVMLHSLLDALAADGVTHCSMEASSHGLDQRRLDGVKLSVAGFTNLGRDHLDYHTDMDDYLRAKLRLFDTLMMPGQPAVIFADDAYSASMVAASKARGLDVNTVGRGGSLIVLKRVEQHRTEQIAELTHGGQVYRVCLPLAGEFQLANALVAAGMTLATGSDAAAVFNAMQNLRGAPGRLERVGQTSEGAPVYVDYAHKPEALESVLTALRPYTTGDLVVVFGCGGDRDPGKRPIMGEIAARLADRVIVTDDNPRTEEAALIRRAVLSAATGAQEIGDRCEAIFEAVHALGGGDTLVVAGKGHEEGQIVGEHVLPFSDHAVVRDALSSREADGAR
ncbi:MAG: UDP-N-acetylmuramoyl-L-alanyl-D-glutamate--2,6-diaminopimelate ligase [Pseudomonadota bacterium]